MAGLEARRNRIDLLFYVGAIVVTFLVRHHFFFWDTVQLASRHAHFFYENNFRSFILPNEIDSGHPPIFGAWLALAWKLFGKTLPVSHFAMLPFLWGIIFFLLKIGGRLSDRKHAPWLVLLCFSSPVLAGQSVLVSPDVCLVCFFLMALWSVWEGKSGCLAIAIIALGLVSTRGMMLGVALYFFSLYASADFKNEARFYFKKILPFLPGGLLALGFLLYHWQQTGWIGYHENSTWAPSFQRVDFRGFIKNAIVFGWRLLDFGQIFLWLGLAFSSFFLFKKRNWKLPQFNRNSMAWQLAALLLLITVFVVPTQLLYKGLLSHRYLLPVFLSVYFIFFRLIFSTLSKSKSLDRFRMPLFCLAFIGMLSGNFWIYPKNISQGWDSTLAHLPWYELEEQVEDFARQSGISLSKIGTVFPAIGQGEIIRLNGVGEGFVEKDLAGGCYVLFSNIMNDFSNEEIAEIEQKWTPVFYSKKRGVYAILYKNPKSGRCEN